MNAHAMPVAKEVSCAQGVAAAAPKRCIERLEKAAIEDLTAEMKGRGFP